MPREITITTGSRLHFGILSFQPERGRHFGGAGLMIDTPGVQLTVSRAERDEFSGPEECVSRCRKFVSLYRVNCPNGKERPQCHFKITSAIPSHVGLGSGTQLGLAVAKTLSLMAGERETDAVTLAMRVGRGARSALGIHGFDRGGFLIDAGKDSESSIGHLEAGEEFPAGWRILLVAPQDGPCGLFGTDEQEALSRLPPMSPETTQRLRRLATEELLPAVQSGDFNRFSRGVFEFGHTVGEFFSPVQDGVYASTQMMELAGNLHKRGVQGVGQTSWGPTLFVPLPDQHAADQLLAELQADARCRNCRLMIARPLNSPAGIEIR